MCVYLYAQGQQTEYGHAPMSAYTQEHQQGMHRIMEPTLPPTPTHIYTHFVQEHR